SWRWRRSGSTSTTACGAASGRWARHGPRRSRAAAGWRWCSRSWWRSASPRCRWGSTSGSCREGAGVTIELDARVPAGPLAEKWDRHRAAVKLVSPANKRKHTILVVGSGLAGASAAATLSELGYRVQCFCFQDSPRRAHSIAAQGGINASKNYQGDGDSAWRLFHDTIKGGDFRAREANVHRLAQISVEIIDQ